MDAATAAQQVIGGAVARASTSGNGPPNAASLRSDAQAEAQLAAYKKAHPDTADALNRAFDRALDTASSNGLSAQMTSQTSALRALNLQIVDTRAQLGSATDATRGESLGAQLSALGDQRQITENKLNDLAGQYAAQMKQDELAQTSAAYATALVQAGLPFTST